MLASTQVSEIIKDIEERGAKALVRGVFGDVCMERRTGIKDIRRIQSMVDGTYLPVPPGFTLILYEPVDILWPTNLNDPTLLREIWESFDGHDDQDYEPKDLSRMVRKLFKTRTPVFRIVGRVEFYTDIPRHSILPSMNGPFKPEDEADEYEELAVEWMHFGEMHLQIIQTDPVIDHQKLGPLLYGRVLMGTEEGFRRGDGISMVLSRPFTGDLRKDLRDMGFWLINQLCQIRKNPDQFKRHLKEQNMKSLKVDQSEDEFFNRMNAAQKVFGKDLDAACEALALEKSWRDISPDLPDTHPFSGLGNKDEPIQPYNLIKHVSDWDGTLRSYKATYALDRYHPISAGQIAQIWIEERNHPLANVEDIQFPMFLEDPALVEFVERNLDDARWKNWYITRWDLTDSIADMWKLSPDLQDAYPTHNKWFQGINIGMGWQELLRQVRIILERAGW